MPPAEVRELIGAATSENTYQTGKASIPYYGSRHLRHEAHRVELQGRGPRRSSEPTSDSGKQKVIRIDYDPTEDGN